MDTCQVCFQPASCVPLFCGDSYCQDCVVQWATTCIATQKLSYKDKIKCINHECSYLWAYDEIAESLDNDNVVQINDCYTDVYISKSSDIITCPRSGCHYAGITASQTCSEPLKCLNCEYEWTLPSQNRFEHQDTFSYFHKVLFGKPCPKCNMTIFKDGGCDIVTCTNCSNKFCWYCQGTHTGCTKSKNQSCILPRLVTPLMTLCIFSLFLLKMYSVCGSKPLSTMQRLFDSASEICSMVVFFITYLSLGSLQIVFMNFSRHEKDEELTQAGKGLRVAFQFLSLAYPFMWCYGFYANFVSGTIG